MPKLAVFGEEARDRLRAVNSVTPVFRVSCLHQLYTPPRSQLGILASNQISFVAVPCSLPDRASIWRNNVSNRRITK
jgi:hypothetical protein